ncbi:arginine/serine-rich coiled-coil protein 2-like isoform X1 [Metopolophium dirhodum]|uniref:arginine/serine-rich coiled-coil protein 2-like isoform X1 n=1 Tax=Metopolophium dirhodum TaxID=44670 RepID=UPI002990143B|nr:arginine/serine-rich coiled-coil protein 2-like isoform X1 [Metopolophium dirhodum]
MESLCNYASDDDNSPTSPSPRREVATKLTRTNGMEADANYEQVTMDMSEQESNHSSTKSPPLKSQTSPSSSASSPPSVSQTSRSRHTSKHGNHSDTKTNSSDEEKKSHTRHRRNKSRDRHSKKHSRRSRSRSSGRKRSRRSRSHSRNKKRSRRSRSRSERNGNSRRSSPHSRHETKNHNKHSRSKSKEKYTSSHNYFLEKKANNKRQILDKLGIELKVPTVGNSVLPSTTIVTPQLLLQKSMEAQVEKVKEQTGIELPSYYNPVAVNPNKYAEQIQKRKLLWGNKQNNEVVKQIEEAKPPVITNNKTATIWQSTKFGDQDGKVTAKFKRLMGIKDPIGVDNQTSQQGQSKDIIKKQEEMFNSMESQYEVARMATHTHRGLGLGFGTFQQR